MLTTTAAPVAGKRASLIRDETPTFHRPRRGRRWWWALLLVAACGVVVAGVDRRPNGPESGTRLAGAALAPLNRDTLRVASFNIHSGVGRDGARDLRRVVQTLGGQDIIALNEVRNGLGNQAQQIAEQLHAGWLFAASERQWWHGHFGNAVVSQVPIAHWQSLPLAGTRGKGFRNLVMVDVPWHGQQVHFLLTHIDREADRVAQLTEVATHFLAAPLPAVLLGDLNSTASDPQIRRLCNTPGVDEPVGRMAEPARTGRIDWIFTRGIDAVAAGFIDNGASDHMCIWAELKLRDSN